MNPEVTLKKVALRACTSKCSLATGGIAIAVSLATMNPLPAILWGLGNSAWTFYAVTSSKYQKKMLTEEQKAEVEKQILARKQMEARLRYLLSQDPFGSWISSGDFPDYGSMYRSLVDIRNRTMQVAHDRPEVGDTTESSLQSQLDDKLGSFIRFVRARITYVQILTGERIENPNAQIQMPSVSSGGHGFRKTLERLLFKPDDSKEQNDRRPVEEFEPYFGRDERGRFSSRRRTRMPNTEARLAEMDQKIKELRRRIMEQPAAKSMYEEHISMLEKSKKFVLECREKDQRVSAQLEAFQSAFEFILDRVSATQFSVQDVSQAMSGLVQNVEETERFIEDTQSGIGELFEGFNADVFKVEA